MAVLVVSEQRGEARARVEAREAEPVDGPLARHERGGLQVADEAVVLDPRGHARTLPRAAPESPVRAVVQRVSSASVRVGGETVGRCGRGLLVLVGARHEDTSETATRLAARVARLRIFPDDDGRFDRSLLDVGGEALVVSQFTLLADSRRQKGTRPSFTDAAPREQAEPLIEAFVDALRAEGVHVETGVFGERMEVELVNDGPVTLILDL